MSLLSTPRLGRTARAAGLIATLAFPALAAIEPQEAAPSKRPEPELPADPDAILGKPFKVGSVTITPTDLKCAIVNGPTGRSLLESARLQVFIDEEIARRVKDEGADPKSFEIPQEEIDKKIAESDEMVRKEYVDNPEITSTRDLFWMPEDLWFDQIRQTQLFDKLFLPEDPNQYPPLTVAALNQQSPDFVDRLKEGWNLRQEQEKENPAAEPPDAQGQAIFRQLMRQLVIGALNKSAEVKTFNDGLPPDAAMEVNGKKIATEDVWKQLRWKISEEDVRDARLWFTRVESLKQAFEREGVYLSDEEFAKVYGEHSDPYKDSPFSIESVAVSFKKFPSPEHYKVYFRLLESYRKLIADEITEENLKKHIEERAGSLLGLAKVDLEVILLSAYDFKLNAFKPDGWEYAKNRAVETVQALASGKPWDEVLEEYSEFYEPPLGVSTRDRAAQFSKNKGRFGLKNRNEILQLLGESDWTLFLYGTSLTDTIFFEAEVGVPTQPIRGPHGYYIALVKSRTAPASTINLETEGHRSLVEQEFLATRLNEYARSLEAGGQ